MVSIQSEFTDSQAINQNLTVGQVGTTVPTSTQHQSQYEYYPIELWGSLGLLGVGFIAVVRGELKRLDRRREIEAEQAEKYVKELEGENRRLEIELKQMRNTVVGLRVRLAESEKEIQLNSGELRSRGRKN